MADETQTQDTAQDTTQPDTTEEQQPTQTESEFMEETVKEIKETQKEIKAQEEGEVADEDTTSDTEQTDDTTADTSDGVLEDLAETDIPDAFTEAAEAAGMTPQEIVEIADRSTDEQLLDMVPTLTAAMEKAAGEKKSEEKTEESAGDTEDVDPDVQQRIIEQVTEQLTEKFGMSLEEMKQFKEQQAAQQREQTFETVNKKLDSAAEEFKIFGKTEELPRFKTGVLKGQLIPTAPAVKAREEVIRYADAFAKMGRSVDEAMDDALATYRGKHLQKEMERKLIKDLKGHEKQLSGGRIGKETKNKFTDSREEMIDEIRQLQRNAGIDV